MTLEFTPSGKLRPILVVFWGQDSHYDTTQIAKDSVRNTHPFIVSPCAHRNARPRIPAYESRVSKGTR